MSANLAGRGLGGKSPRRLTLKPKSNTEEQPAGKSTDAGTRREGKVDMRRADPCYTQRQAQHQAWARGSVDGHLAGKTAATHRRRSLPRLLLRRVQQNGQMEARNKENVKQNVWPSQKCDKPNSTTDAGVRQPKSGSRTTPAGVAGLGREAAINGYEEWLRSDRVLAHVRPGRVAPRNRQPRGNER